MRASETNQKLDMPTILIVTDYYLPGYRGGGVVRTLVNAVDWFSDEFDFKVLTRDRDFKSETPYPDVQYGEWQPVHGADVRYLAPEERSITNIGRIIRELNPDLVYINSFFAVMCVKTLWANFLRLLPGIPVLIAPRDELNPARMALKTFKKRPYLMLFKLVGLHQRVIWQATNDQEHAVLRAHFPRADIRLARDVATKDLPAVNPTKEKAERLQLVFISRIARSKNLTYAFEVLKHTDRPIWYDIYGPKEDPIYWKECAEIITTLPDHVQVAYKGELLPDDVVNVFAQYDAFLFPTMAENYGHVIWEALYAGCLPIISDGTPWRDIPGWVIPLDNPDDYLKAINELADMPQAAYQAQREAAHKVAIQRAHDPAIIEENRQLFLQTVRR